VAADYGLIGFGTSAVVKGKPLMRGIRALTHPGPGCGLRLVAAKATGG
jgi:hypothetical protein